MLLRSRSLTFLLILILFLVVIARTAFTFYLLVPEKPVTVTCQVDAIVVLTGDRYRIKQAFDLLKAGKGKVLFISGIRTNQTNVDNLFPQLQTSSTRGRVFVGKKADNTIENAKETAEFIREKGIRSMYLVTSSYHIPRATLEFNYFVPYVKIYPYPIDSQRKESSERYLIFSEYVKYYFAKFWHFLEIENKE